MSISDLNNTAIEFTLAEKKYKIKRLNLLDIFNSVEKSIKEEYVQSVTELSKALPDKDRVEFLRSAIKEMPTSKRLEEMVNDKINTTSGGVDILTIILNKCQSVSKEEVVNIISDNKNAPDVSAIMAYALNAKQEEEQDDGKKK